MDWSGRASAPQMDHIGSRCCVLPTGRARDQVTPELPSESYSRCGGHWIVTVTCDRRIFGRSATPTRRIRDGAGQWGRAMGQGNGAGQWVSGKSY